MADAAIVALALSSLSCALLEVLDLYGCHGINLGMRCGLGSTPTHF